MYLPCLIFVHVYSDKNEIQVICCFSKSVTAKLRANSLLLGPIKENIMESFMVKYYCNMLIPNESCEVVSSVTEDLVHFFLTIRGYAVTRLERNKLQKSSNGKPGKASLSLRRVLKEKVHN